MINTSKLAGKTLFITGASRGIGKAIALRAARDGANIVVAAKTGEPHPKLPGTIYTAAQEIESAGGKALPCIVDVRDENQIRTAVQQAVDKFGGIDILVNNASAISLTQTDQTDMKRFDLMMSINTRGTFLTSKICLPYLKKSNHAHILNISPPLNMQPHWFGMHVAYTMAKYGMSMCVLGMAEEFKPFNIGVNALWPATAIHTAAIEMLTGPDSAKFSRKPEIVADAAYEVLSRDPKTSTGNFFVDEDVLKTVGINDLTHYACHPENVKNLMPDFFLNVGPNEITKFATAGSHSAEAYKPKSGEPPITLSNVTAETIPALFKRIESFITPEVMQKTNAVFEFEVTGAEAGHWFVDLKNDNGKCGRGKAPVKPDAILKMDSHNLNAMFGGKLKPASAFMTGKLKISGDMQKAMKLEKLMTALKSKL